MSFYKTDEDLFSVFLNAILTWFVAMPINAVVLSKTASVIWKWTVESRYGAGPSLGAWFGLSCIFGLFIAATGVTTDERPEDRSRLVHTVAVTAGIAVGCLLMLAGVATIKKMFGW